MKRPLESRNIEYWRSKASLLTLLVVAGCSQPAEVKVSSDGGNAGVVLETASFTPTVAFAQDFGLENGPARLILGVKRDRALTVFPQPKGAFQIDSLPLGLGPDFGAFGWESEDRAFGCLTLTVRDPDTKKVIYKDLVVLAMTTLEHVSEGAVLEAVSEATEHYGKPTDAIQSKEVSYYFWSNPLRRMMIVSVRDQQGKRTLTTAIGAPQVMSELGMSPRQAVVDHKLALERLSVTEVK